MTKRYDEGLVVCKNSRGWAVFGDESALQQVPLLYFMKMWNSYNVYLG